MGNPNLDRVILRMTLGNGHLIIPNVNVSFSVESDANGKRMPQKVPQRFALKNDVEQGAMSHEPSSDTLEFF